MRTTTLALLSGAAMSISAASIYNVTPAGGFGDAELLEPPAPRSWPALEPAGDPLTAAISTAAPTASPSAFAPPAQTAFVGAPATAFALEEPPASTAVAFAEPTRPAQFAAAKPPSTKSASGWRVHRNPKPAFEASFVEPQKQQRVAAKQEPQPPPQMARPMSTSSFQSAPPASSFAAPASTARPTSSAF